MARLVHFAAAVREDGGVLPMCRVLSLLNFSARPINMRVATWTNRREAVSCKACLLKLKRIDATEAKEGK